MSRFPQLQFLFLQLYVSATQPYVSATQPYVFCLATLWFSYLITMTCNYLSSIRPVRAKALKLQTKHKAFALTGRVELTCET